MFGWLFPSSDPTFIPEKQRNIYRYFNGVKVVASDPMEIYRAIMDVAGDLEGDIQVAFSAFKLKGAAEAHNNMIAKLHSIFKINHLKDGGLTDMECVDLLNHFLDFCNKIRNQFENVVDMTGGNVGQLMSYTGKKPTYIQLFGFWLNRKRMYYRQAAAITLGVQVALGFIDPGIGFYETVSDGYGEALKMKAIVDMSRRRSSDG